MTDTGAPALEPLVDTHVHMWNLAHPSLTWNWIDTPDDHPVLGNIDSVKMRAFEMRHLEAESRFAGVEAFVHVQAALGSADPVEETRWLTQMAQVHPALQALVGHADLGSPRSAEQLAGHLESPIFRGVRDFAIEPYLASDVQDRTMENGLRRLTAERLVLDLDCEYPNMAAARALAERHPELVVVLEHIGFPRRRDDEYRAAWRAGISDLADAPNVVCKVSGIAMTDRGFTLDSLRPWVRHCVESFGPSRVMVGSNWPLDRVVSSYDAIMSHVRALIAEDSAADQVQMLRSTAQRVYRL